MVNIGAILYFGKNLDIRHFKSEDELISWKTSIDSFTSEAERDQWEFNYYHRTREREKRVEELFNIRRGLLIGAHLVFSNRQLMELYVAKKEVLEAIEDDNHVIILEFRRNPLRNIATFYSKNRQFSLLIEPRDPLIEEDVERRVGREARIPRLD